MKKRIRHKSAIPVYAVAAVFVLWGLFLPLYNLLHIALLVICAGAVYAGVSGLFKGTVEEIELPPEPVTTGDDQIDALLRDGERAVAEMRAVQNTVSNEAVKAKIGQIIDVTERIFKDVIDDPTDYRQVRRFSELYLPTTMKLLHAYDRFGASGATGEHVSGTIERIDAALDSIIASYEKQYDALFKNQALDIETDIIVLNNMLKREGLLSEFGKEG